MHSKELEEYKRKLKLAPIQREVLVGILLGDAHLETQNKGRTYRLKIEQSEKHRAYVEHLYEIFKLWVNTPPQRKIRESWGKENCRFWFQTLSHSAFRFYAHQFYKEGKKCIPRLIYRWLTPRVLAYWFMDDGSIKSKQSKGVIFNTQCYTKPEIERLIQVFRQKFELQTKLRKQKEGFQIYVSGKSYERFRELVEAYLLEEMKYKLPEARLTQLPKM